MIKNRNGPEEEEFIYIISTEVCSWCLAIMSSLVFNNDCRQGGTLQSDRFLGAFYTKCNSPIMVPRVVLRV